jgi:hypothetical protein
MGKSAKDHSTVLGHGAWVELLEGQIHLAPKEGKNLLQGLASMAVGRDPHHFEPRV